MAEARLKGSNLDIGRLVADLEEVTDWFKVGMRLCIKHSVLKEIEVDHKSDGVERCKTEMLVYWCDNDKNASLKKLTDALEEANYGRLAKYIRRNYNVPSNQTGSETSGMLLNLDEVINPRSSRAKHLIHRKCMIDVSDSSLKKEYAEFMKKLLKLLTTKEVSVDDAIFVVNLQDETALTSDMQEAIDMQSFLHALRSTQSWYNFDITASLALDFGEDEGKELVESYETKLTKHLTERIQKHTSDGRTKTRRFVIKVNEKPELFLEEKHIKFRITIARILNLKQEELVLKSAKKGCVELTYLFRADLAPHIRSAMKNCGNDLQMHHVMSVKIDSEVLWTWDLEQSTSSQRENSDSGPKRLTVLKDVPETRRSQMPLKKAPTRSKMRSIPMIYGDFNQHQVSGHPCRRLRCQLILRRLGQRKHRNICVIIFIFLLIVFALWYCFH